MPMDKHKKFNKNANIFTLLSQPQESSEAQDAKHLEGGTNKQ